MEMRESIRRTVARYDPVEAEGLILHPILVGEYESFLKARPAIAFLPRSLPVQYLSEPLLSAFYRIEYDAIQAGETPQGLLYRCILFLALSLGVGKGLAEEERVGRFRLTVDPENPARLMRLETTTDEGEPVKITPVQFQRLRPILAVQNGIDLPSDDANPDLVEAEREIAAQKGPKLDVSVETLVSSVALFTGTDEADIYRWPVLKLERRREAISRALHFLVCGIGEASGGRFKGGNPCPSPFFDRVSDESVALVSLDSFAGGAGKQAVQQAGGSGAPAPMIDFPKGG